MAVDLACPLGAAISTLGASEQHSSHISLWNLGMGLGLSYLAARKPTVRPLTASAVSWVILDHSQVFGNHIGAQFSSKLLLRR